MADRPIEEVVERLAEGLVFTEPDDQEGLSNVLGLLREITRWAERETNAQAAQAAYDAAQLVQCMLDGETEDADAALRIVGNTVSILQGAIRSGPGPREAAPLLVTEHGEHVERAERRGNGTAGQSAAPAPFATLPDYIDEVIVSDFLKRQPAVLEEVETHLLSLESGRTEETVRVLRRIIHTLKGEAALLELNDVQVLCHTMEETMDGSQPERFPVDALLRAKDWLSRTFAACSGQGPPPEDVEPVLRELEEGAAAAAAPRTNSFEPLAGGEAMREEPHDPVVTMEAGEADAPGRIEGSKAAAPSRMVHVRETVIVDADRLDRFVDMIGEMVIAEAVLRKSLEHERGLPPETVRQVSHLNKITRGLQKTGMFLRMIPLHSTFNKMSRLVRDLARKSGLAVEFSVSGQDTEIDKTVVDRINEPLVHLVRNCLAHGIERDPEERRRAGKPENGRLELRAFYQGGNVHIEVEDDGRGLRRDEILSRACGMGLVREDAYLTDEQVFRLILEPGFSTAGTVTELSGRGVGMDVVRSAVEALHGQVRIRSTPGKGTTVTLQLPLTTAVIDGMVARVGTERYILPTLSVVSFVNPTRTSISSVLGRGETISFQGRTVPVFRLHRLFDVSEAARQTDEAMAAVVEVDGRMAALLFDSLEGQQQVVIKSMGEVMQGIPGISGGAVMPDGNVGIILDVAGLIKLAHSGAPEARPAELVHPQMNQ